MILTADEISYYAPSVSVTGGELAALINAASLLVQGPLGSNCPLAKQLRKEQRAINYALQTINLAYHPVYVNDPISLQVRYGNVRNRYHVPQGISEWINADPGSYIFDDNGQINFTTGSSISGFSRTLNTSGITEIRIEYQAGLDFTQANPEVIEIKQAFGAILTALANSSMNQLTGVGITSEKDNFLGDAVSYGNFGQNSKVTGVADFLLLPFHKYQPRGFHY